MKVVISQADLDRIMRKLKTLENARSAFREPMEQGLALMQDDIAKYPVKSPGAFSRLATPAQKRAYWARVRAGEIQHREGVGYVRTGILGKSWTSTVKSIAGGLRGILGTNTPYAVYVQKSPGQQAFHAASKWPITQQVAKKHSTQIRSLFQARVKRILDAP